MYYQILTGLEPSNATVRWTVAADGLTAANLNFAQQNANESQADHHKETLLLPQGRFFILSISAWTRTIKCNSPGFMKDAFP